MNMASNPGAGSFRKLVPDRAPLHNQPAMTEVVLDLSVIRRHFFNVLLLVLFCSIISWLIISRISPTYRAAAVVAIEGESTPFRSVEELYANGGASQEYRSTQVEIIRSRVVTQQVVRRLNLVSHPEFNPQPGGGMQLFGYWMDKYSWVPKAGSNADGVQEEQVMSAVQSSLNVRHARNSQLITVEFVASNPNLAASVANAYVKAFFDVTNDSRRSVTAEASGYFEERADALQSDLKASEARLQAYREQNDILDSGGSLSLAERRLQDLSLKLVDSESALAIHKTNYEQINQLRSSGSKSLESLPIVQRDAIASKLIVDMGQLEKEIQQIDKRYGGKHPNMIDARSRLLSTKESLDRQIERIAESALKQYETSLAAQEILQREIVLGRSEAQSTNRKRFTLRELEREVETNQRMYETFFERVRATQEAGGAADNSARVIQSAAPPLTPFKPEKLKLLSIMILLSTIAGFGLAYLKEMFDNGVRSPDALLTELGVNVLGCVPRVRSLGKKNSVELLDDDKNGEFKESMLSLSTSILTSSLTRDMGSSFLIASALPGEGKSNISLHLAEALAEVGDTVLVDMDLRKRALSESFMRGRMKPGLYECYRDEATLDEVIISRSRENFDFVGIGKDLRPNEAHRMVNNQQWISEFIKELESKYQFVVIDGAPLQPVSDSLAIGSSVSGVLFVVKAASTPLKLVEECLAKLVTANCEVLGAVLNQFDAKDAGDMGYGYGYGYGYGNNSSKRSRAA